MPNRTKRILLVSAAARANAGDEPQVVPRSCTTTFPAHVDKCNVQSDGSSPTRLTHAVLLALPPLPFVAAAISPPVRAIALRLQRQHPGW
jgi:hypothetical protein